MSVKLPQMLSKQQVAKSLGVSLRTISRMIANGHLPQPIRIGSTGATDRWELDDIVKFLKGKKRPAKK